MVYKTLQSRVDVDLIPYCQEYIKLHPQIEVLIGCDSQNRKRTTTYAIVVGLYNPGKGAHVLYNRFEIPREKDNIGRLLNEVWYSVQTAEEFKNKLNIIPEWIDIDLNPDPKYRSNQALSSAVGVVTGMGYKVRHKGLDPMMTYASDKLIK